MHKIKIITIIAVLLGWANSYAQNGAVTGYCVKGATPAITSGLNSSNTLQGIVPGGSAGCLVQVYLTGTTNPAIIYSTVGGGTLNNPFRASLSGQWLFYAASSSAYDVVLSGGIAPNIYQTPVTLTGLNAGGSGGSGGSPAGANFSVQYNNSGSFGGAGFTGPVYNNGTSASPSAETASQALAVFGTQSDNFVLAGPCTGAAATPTFRVLCSADLPTITLAGDVTGPIGSNTVVKVNGGAIPASTNVVGSNGAGQIIAAANGSTTVFGPVKVDGTTISAAGGVISTIGGGCSMGTCVLNNPTGAQTVVQPIVSTIPTQLNVNVLHGLNSDYTAVNNIGDSICWGQGVGPTSTTASIPGVLGSPSQPLGFCQLLQATYGDAGEYTAYPGDEAADQTVREYAELATPQVSGNPPTTLAVGTNDAALCGTSTACQTTFNLSMLFMGADRGIPISARVPAPSCTSSGFTQDTNPPFGMYASSIGATLTCTLVTAGNPIYMAYMRQSAFGSGSLTVTVDGGSCSGSPLVPTGFGGTGNGAPYDLAAARCTSVSAGTHTIVYTSTTTGTSEVLWTGSAPQPNKTIFAPPFVVINGVPWDEGDIHEPQTGIYDGLALAVATQLAADGINAVGVDIRNQIIDSSLGAFNSTTSYTGGVVGGRTWCATNAAPYHPGCLGHYQLYLDDMAAMQPLLRGGQTGSLWAGTFGSIDGFTSTSGVYSPDSIVKSILRIRNTYTGSSQTFLRWDTTGGNAILAGQFGSGNSGLSNNWALYDATNATLPLLVGPDGSTCLLGSVANGATTSLGCPFAATYIKAGSQSTGVQFVIGAQSDPALEACSYGASSCGAGAHLKLQAPTGNSSVMELDAGGSSGSNYTAYAMFQASAPSGNRYYRNYTDYLGNWHQQLCNDAVTSCSDFMTYIPSSATLGLPSHVTAGDFNGVALTNAGSSSNCLTQAGTYVSCTAGGGGTVTTSGTPTNGFVSLFTGSTVIGNSHLDDGVTTASTITSTEPINIAATSTPSAVLMGADGVAPAVTTGFAGWGINTALTTGGFYLMPDAPGTGIWHAANAAGIVTNTLSAVNLASADVTGLLPHTNIASTAVTPGSYTSANITVAADGSITAAANGSGGSATIIQVNGTPTTTSTPVNLRDGSGNAGIAITNPSTGNVDINLSKPFGAGANFTTGPATNTVGDLVYFPGTDGRIADAGVAYANIAFNNAANVFTQANTILTLNLCADTSGSGTAQVCNMQTPTFTPFAGTCMVYSTSTANTGTGLTINVNGLGAKSVSKWMGSTTTLAANDVLAGKQTTLCYDGTTWELQDIGNAPSGSGGITFPQTVSGTVNSGGLVYANSGTQISISSAGTAGQAVLWGGAGTAPTAKALAGTAAGIVTGPTTTIANDAVCYNSVSGDIHSCSAGNGPPAILGGVNNFSMMFESPVQTTASATTIAPTRAVEIITGTTTISTITPPAGTGATTGAYFDFIATSTGGVTLTTGGNIGSVLAAAQNTLYHCTYFGSTNGFWYCK